MLCHFWWLDSVVGLSYDVRFVRVIAQTKHKDGSTLVHLL